MSCGCDFDSCGNLRHMCARCSALVNAGRQVEEATQGVEGALNNIAKAIELLAKAIREKWV